MKIQRTFKNKIIQNKFNIKPFCDFRGSELLLDPDLMKLKNEFHSKRLELNQGIDFSALDNSKSKIPTSKFDLNHYIKDIVFEENNHPCFVDYNYVKRKQYIQMISLKYNFGDDFPIIDYTEEEDKTWEACSSKLIPKIKSNCCKEFTQNFELLQKEANVKPNKLPQMRDISNFLEEKTGFTIVPVAGLLRPRVFLNLLAFKVFPSALYIRPLKSSEHNGEPDIMHEIIGHTSMLLDSNFADFSQEIGLASLGASEEDLKKLANIYWFTVEYGLVKEFDEQSKQNKIKVYGGGIVASSYELDYALEMKANYYDLDFDKVHSAYYDYTNLSTNYFIANSIEDMKLKFREYSKNIKEKRITL